MSRCLVFLFFILKLGSFSFAQDTIYVNNSSTLIVRVLEISSTSVSYKNFHNPDGIIRSLSNDQILRIVYENGKEESRFQLKQKTTGSTSTLKLFIVEGKHIALNNKDISHKAAFKIMMLKDPQTNSDELNETLVVADSRKNGQIAFNIIAPVSAVAGIYLARQHRYNDPKEQMKARTYFLSGLSVCVLSLVTAQIYKSLKNKQIRKAALLYNADLINVND
jgi:DeoR/GlpR family transcriptional regulator of sugar metabolism